MGFAPFLQGEGTTRFTDFLSGVRSILGEQAVSWSQNEWTTLVKLILSSTWVVFWASWVALVVKRCKRRRFHPWVGKIPWRKA